MLQLYPSSRERVVVVLAAEGVVAEANDGDALRAFQRGGDLTKLVIPASACKFTISPLTASAVSYARRRAGPLSKAAIDAYETARSAHDAALATGASEEEATHRAAHVRVDHDAAAEVQAWTERHALAQVCASLKLCSAFPDVAPAEVDGIDQYPADIVDRLQMDARMELAGHVARISRLGDEGKAYCGSPSGAPQALRTSGLATGAEASSEGSAATAAGPLVVAS